MGKLRRDRKAYNLHPSAKELLEFVKRTTPKKSELSGYRAGQIKKHVGSCASCANHLKQAVQVMRERLDVEIDIKMGGILETYKPQFGRFEELKSLTAWVSRHRRRSGTKSQQTTVH